MCNPFVNAFRDQHIARLFEEAKAPIKHINSWKEAKFGTEWLNIEAKLILHEKKGFIFCLIGERGTGKTQLGANLIAKKIYKEVESHVSTDRYFDPLPIMPARYIQIMDFFMEMKHSFRKDSLFSEKQVMEKYMKPQLLVIDEITVRGETKWEDDLFVRLIDKRYADEKDTLLIGNLSTSEVLANLGPSIASRMVECGGIIQCNWPSFRKTK